MSTFLYLRGEPGSGKITTARILERDLGWLLCWFHDLDGVYRIIGEYQVPRLMDEVMQVVVKHLLPTGRDIIYVRPSRDAESVEKVRQIVAGFPEYRFCPVRLYAPYDVLLNRVERREGKPYRIQDKVGLDEYLQSRPLSKVPGEIVVSTDCKDTRSVAEQIKWLLNHKYKEQANGRYDGRREGADQESNHGANGGAGDRQATPVPARHAEVQPVLGQ
jgi:hypothetical protein